jgi:hypothetical protein
MPVSTATLDVPIGSFKADCVRDATGPFPTFTLTPASQGTVKGATGYEVVPLPARRGRGSQSPSSREPYRSSP